MQIELRKYKPSKALSEETLAFSAEIWIDGEKSATVSNHGTGGPNMYYWHRRDDEARFESHIASLPAREPAADAPDWEKKIGAVKMDADWFIGELCDAMEFQKRLKRLTKTQVLFRIAGDKPSEFRTVKFKQPHREAALKYVRDKYGADVVEIY